ncbi:hypothetical protein PIB30_092956, partial [Stylosanthes scabra]|nr:hypothetical protein [Stylosanthes scabra]
SETERVDLLSTVFLSSYSPLPQQSQTQQPTSAAVNIFATAAIIHLSYSHPPPRPYPGRCSNPPTAASIFDTATIFASVVCTCQTLLENVGKLHKTSQILGASLQHVSHPKSFSGSGARARHSDIRLFCPPRDKASSDPSDSVENRHPPERCPIHMNQTEVDNTDIEDEDYVPDADEMSSFDDHINNLFANHDAEEQNKGEKRKDIDWWDVEVIEDGVIRPLKQTMFEAVTIPPCRKIVLRFNESHQE